MKSYLQKKMETKPLTEFELRVIDSFDSNHKLFAAIIKELERLNENIEKLKNEKI